MRIRATSAFLVAGQHYEAGEIYDLDPAIAGQVLVAGRAVRVADDDDGAQPAGPLSTANSGAALAR